MKDTALLVIDVQVGMFTEEYPVHEGAALLDKLSGIIAKAREAQVPVVYVQHNEKPGQQLATGSPDWEIHPTIAPQEGELVIQKDTPDSFHNTTLQQELEARGITKLILTGIQSDMCVDTTTRRAFSLGYESTLVADAHSTWGTEQITAEQIKTHCNSILRWFADVKEAKELQF